MDTIVSFPDMTVNQVDYVVPNETYPEAFRQILSHVKGGVLISVGTFRGLIDACMGTFDRVILLDYNKKATVFNKLNLELLIKINELPVSIRERRILYVCSLYGHWPTNEELALLATFDKNTNFDSDFLRTFRKLYAHLDGKPNNLTKFPAEIADIINQIIKLNIQDEYGADIPLLSYTITPGLPSKKYYQALLDPYYRFNYDLSSPQATEYLKKYDEDSDTYLWMMTYNPERHSYYFENDECWLKIINLILTHRIQICLASIYNNQVFTWLHDFLHNVGERVAVIDLSNALAYLDIDILPSERLAILSEFARNILSLPGISITKTEQPAIILQTIRNNHSSYENCRGWWCYTWYPDYEFIKRIIAI